MKDKSIIAFLTKQFPDEKSARAYFMKQRWDKQPKCPYGCRSKIYNINNKIQPYKCSECRKLFSIKTGTIMEGSPIDVRIWLLAMWILGNLKSGISSYQLAYMLGITQRTAWYMAHRIRQACIGVELLSGAVEMDATYVGGLEKNKPAKDRNHKGGTSGKLPVIAMIERGGQVIAKAVDGENKTTIFALADKYIAKSSTIYTDEHSGYKGLNRRGYRHLSVNHSKGEYVRMFLRTRSRASLPPLRELIKEHTLT